MKLRIKGNSMRLRLTQLEVKKFAETEVCFDSISFGENELTYQIHMADVEEVIAEYGNQTIQVAVPYTLAEKWVNDETMVGFDFVQTLKNGEELFIYVEKDFKCLAQRPHEDESDNFPNPKSGEIEC